jgi:hypothetical protein
MLVRVAFRRCLLFSLCVCCSIPVLSCLQRSCNVQNRLQFPGDPVGRENILRYSTGDMLYCTSIVLARRSARIPAAGPIRLNDRLSLDAIRYVLHQSLCPS